MTKQQNKMIGNLPIVKPSTAMQHLKILVYGYPGVGKTVFAATANDDKRTSPALLIDLEGGTLSIADKNIDVVRVTEFKQLSEVYQYLRNGSHYKTVIIDSLTEVQKLNMYEILQQAVAANPARDPDIPRIDEWGKSVEQMRRLVRYFRDLPMHVIITALAQEVRDERDGNITVKPALPGRLSDEVSGFLDIVGYLGVLEKAVGEEHRVIRQMLTRPMGKFIAKDRSGKLDQFIEEPTVAKLLDRILSKPVEQ